MLTPVLASEVCISIVRCFGRFKESTDSRVRLVLSLLSTVHNVTTEFAWIHHPPYRFSHLFPFPLADNVSHYFTKGSTLFNNVEINNSLEKISLLN